MLVRKGYPELVEPSLLARLVTHPKDRCFVLIHLVLIAELAGQQSLYERRLVTLAREFPHTELTRWLQLRYWIATRDEQAIQRAGQALWHGESESPYLRLIRCRYEFARRDYAQAQACLEALPSELSKSLDAEQCRGDLAELRGDPYQALQIWLPLVARAPRCRFTLLRAMNLAITCRHSNGVLAAIRRGLDEFGEHPDFLNLVGSIKLYQRQPGLARRALLLAMVWKSLGLAYVDVSNLLTSYEMLGLVAWLEYTLDHQFVDASSGSFDANRCMQLASLISSQYQDHVESYLERMRSQPAFWQFRSAGGQIPSQKSVDLSPQRPLTVAWVTGDLNPHPVSRFLLQFFSAASGSLQHRHLLVSTFDHGLEACTSWFEEIPDLSLINVADQQPDNKVAAIRQLKPDVAIDLAGWTANHFMAGFMARLAPVQVNYLGFFASTGLVEMDYWLGDSALFPSPMHEYHQEKIWRLDRPFLAWQPCSPLPEAEAQVCDANNGPVRFGSFNHNRKLSNATIALWGKLLRQIPESRLVLKANAKDDIFTQKLLRKRFVRYGLDPDRVDWLELTAGPREHLDQYRWLDIALDPIPNGGCTTSCEALWMGVPVVTLRGAAYVSRMSTAVLEGAGLPEWIAHNPDHYLEICRNAAADISRLRTIRARWRDQLITSPLGDAKALMMSLEASFAQMLHQQCALLAS